LITADYLLSANTQSVVVAAIYITFWIINAYENKILNLVNGVNRKFSRKDSSPKIIIGKNGKIFIPPRFLTCRCSGNIIQCTGILKLPAKRCENREIFRRVQVCDLNQ